MKKILFIMCVILFGHASFAQEDVVPQNYKLAAAGDYARYEKDVIRAVDWLQASTPEVTETKRQVSLFLMDWINGSPDVTINVWEDIVNFSEPNSELLLVFMAGWTKYALETRKFDDELNGNIKGLECVIAYYQKNKAQLAKDTKVEAYAELLRQNKLAAYIKNKLASAAVEQKK